MAQTPRAGTGYSVGRFSRYHWSTLINYNSNLSMCGTVLKILLPPLDFREFLSTQKEAYDLNLSAVTWEFGHFDPQHRFFVPNNCTIMVCFQWSPLSSFFLEFRRPNLITGLSGWRAPDSKFSHLGPTNLSRTGEPEYYLVYGRPKQIPYKWVKQITMLVVWHPSRVFVCFGVFVCLFVCLFVGIKLHSAAASCWKGSKPPGSDHTWVDAQTKSPKLKSDSFFFLI